MKKLFGMVDDKTPSKKCKRGNMRFHFYTWFIFFLASISSCSASSSLLSAMPVFLNIAILSLKFTMALSSSHFPYQSKVDNSSMLNSKLAR